MLKPSWKRGGFLENGTTLFILPTFSQLWETLLICGNSFCSLVKINVQHRKSSWKEGIFLGGWGHPQCRGRAGLIMEPLPCPGTSDTSCNCAE
uniref:Uncharacterized protein n=1 Tax=Cyanistes caeruleus TaxID=156563 RepID=A0A8C0VGF3_CYACU